MMHTAMDYAVDRSFGIRYENGHFMMGDKIMNKVLQPIWKEYQQEGIVHSDDDEKYSSGDGLYLQKNGICFNVGRIGTRMYLRPRPMLAGVYGNGLYIRRGSSIYDGEGLLLGPSTPFKKIPISGWIL